MPWTGCWQAKRVNRVKNENAAPVGRSEDDIPSTGSRILVRMLSL